MSHNYNEEDFIKAKYFTSFELKCDTCGVSFQRNKKNILTCFNRSKSKLDFCSSICSGTKVGGSVQVNCGNCKLPITINRAVKNNSLCGENFCSRSCSVTYRNTHKTKGTRRSKMEIWIEEQLTAIYPTLEIQYGKKDIINSELDIYIPSLKLAFELNGIFHYEPIYGSEKLAQIKNNDGRKFQACLERGIELCILDTSKVTYCVPKNFQKFLDIITNIINSKF